VNRELKTSYEDALKELIPLLKDVWKKVDSGFYPEVAQELKLLAIQTKIKAGQTEEGFWDLVKFLIQDLLAMSTEDFSEEKENLVNILKTLTDQATIQQYLEKMKMGFQTGDKAIGIIESLQQNLFKF